MRTPLGLFAAFVVAMTSPSASPSVNTCSIKPQYEWYSVQGGSPQEIRASLLSQGPRDERGKVRFAYTDWTIEWDWNKQAGRYVSVDSVRVLCSATIKLPRLEVTQNTSLSVIRAWNDFVERTHDHELRHLEHVIHGAGRIVPRLRDYEQRHGRVSTVRANALISRIVEEVHGFDREYDRQTNHGQTEGTWDIL